MGVIGRQQGADGEDWFDRLPKVELHLHLEGAIPLVALWALIEKYGGDPNVPDAGALRQRFRYSDFPHFIDTWVWKNDFLREYDDFTHIAESVAEDLAEQNILYAEIFYSPGDFGRHGIEVEELTAAIREGFDRVEGIRVALVADLIRDHGPERGAALLERIASVKDRGVVGIGIGGSEHLFPPEPFAPVYERARELGFRTSAHAGEAAGPESVWGALRELRVDRVGHATRAFEDPRLEEFLVREGVPVELCPWSNVRTAVVPSIEDHPVGRYHRAGMRISVNSDDPKMFGTSVADELRALVRYHGFTGEDVRRLLRDTVAQSWLDRRGQSELIGRFESDPAWGEEPPAHCETGIAESPSGEETR